MIIAGPNGAGKSTFSQALLSTHYGIPYAFDWDKLFYQRWSAYGSDPAVKEGVRNSVNETFQTQLEESFSNKISFAYETNFQDQFNIDVIVQANQLGFETRVLFLMLDSPEIAIERVDQRVKEGGHFVEEDTIRFRFEKGLTLLDNYFDLPGKIRLFDTSTNWLSSNEPNKSVAVIEHGAVTFLDNLRIISNLRNSLPRLYQAAIKF
ncbi:MAG: zeta toxin family protein [Bacteroidota bacterium]